MDHTWCVSRRSVADDLQVLFGLREGAGLFALNPDAVRRRFRSHVSSPGLAFGA